MVQPALNYQPTQDNSHLDLDEASLLAYSQNIPLVLSSPFQAAYKDILQFYDRLAGLSFYGSQRDLFATTLRTKLEQDKSKLPSRHVNLPLEYRIEEQPSLLGECIFDKSKNLWVPATDKTQDYKIFLGINTDFYSRNYK